MRALVGMTALAASMALAACTGEGGGAEANNTAIVADTLVPAEEGEATANAGDNVSMNASDRGSDDRGSDDRGSDDRGSDDRGSDDRGSDDR